MPDGYESFAAFVAARQGALLRAATLVSGDHHLAEDLPERQVAELLGVTVGTVKRQVHAALARLRALVPELEREKGARG
jgi:DNA-directed RNA polymerase specialized sigma24 family protein